MFLLCFYSECWGYTLYTAMCSLQAARSHLCLSNSCTNHTWNKKFVTLYPTPTKEHFYNEHFKPNYIVPGISVGVLCKWSRLTEFNNQLKHFYTVMEQSTEMYGRNKIFHYILQYGLKTLQKKKRKKHISLFIFHRRSPYKRAKPLRIA